MNFEYYMPVKLVFGCGKVSLIGEAAAKYGHKAFIVTGRSSTKKTGLLDRVIKHLTDADVEAVVFDKIGENPLTTTVEAGAQLVGQEKCDVIIGLGGGSAIDAAKGIAFLAKNEGDISEYIFGKQGGEALPLIAVTTTAGTGSEGDCLAVLTNPETKDKKALKSPAIYPKVSIVDPELMMTLPQYLIASTGIDALCHCLEAYIANRANPFTEALALKGIETISESLPKIYDDPGDAEAWEKMSYANTIGGMVIDSAGVALAHGLEHSVSGLLNIRHGEGLSAILIPFMEYTLPMAVKKFTDIARVMGQDIEGLTETEAAEAAITAVKNLLERVNLIFTLGKLGVKEEHIDWLVANSLKTMTYAITNNPKVPCEEEIKELYLKCL